MAAAAVAAHVVAALRVDAWTATLGEARLAVAVAVARGAEVVADPLLPSDRFAALQLAVVQTVLPTGGAAVVDAARWACLLFGLVAALLVWPILRRLRVSTAATAVGVALAGVSLPALALHSGISAAAPAAAWLATAAALAAHERGRAAVVAVVVAVATAPLVAAAVLALVAHLVLARLVRRVGRYRLPVGVGAAVAAVVVAVPAVGWGPLAGVAGPDVSTPVAVAGAAVGLLLVLLAARVAGWLRPTLPATVLLLAVGLVPGPSRATAALLVVPVLAVALAVAVEQVTRRLGALVAVLVVLVGPTVAAPAALPGVPARGADLLAWLATDTGPAVAVGADALDRAELLAAGLPAARLRGGTDPPVPGELWLVADRPDGGRPAARPTRCADGSVVAATARDSGGAPAQVCRTDGGGPAVAAENAARARLGTALAGNPSLLLTAPAAATLRAGAVDPRLMLVLAALTTAHRLAVADFPAVALDAPDLPRRRAVLTAVDGTDPASSELLRTWLSGQQPPFVPTLVAPEGPNLVVGYPAPPPGGLLPE